MKKYNRAKLDSNESLLKVVRLTENTQTTLKDLNGNVVYASTTMGVIVDSSTLDCCLEEGKTRILYESSTNKFYRQIISPGTFTYNGKSIDVIEEKLTDVTMLCSKVQTEEIDPLTNLLKKSSIENRLKERVRRAMHELFSFVLVIIDVDNFKSVNDDYGHFNGDEVLKYIGNVIKNNIREVDEAGRYGGDEFLILFKSDDPEGVLKKMNSIKDIISSHCFPFKDESFSVTISGGISKYEFSGSEVNFINQEIEYEKILSQVDLALNKSKRNEDGSIKVKNTFHIM